MYKHLMVAYDGSELSDRALDEAIAFAKHSASRISLLYVLAPHHLMMGTRSTIGIQDVEQQHMETFRQHAREMLGRAHERVRAAGIQGDVVLEEGLFPYEHIVKCARRLQCDLIMMASHGRRGIEALVVGSQTAKVIANSTLPVLVVR